MNNNRRARIQALIYKLNDIQSDIEIIKDEEQEYYDNMPESIQAGERGDKATEAIENLESTLDYLNDVTGFLEEALA